VNLNFAEEGEGEGMGEEERGWSEGLEDEKRKRGSAEAGRTV
jgi:hypothetical protein